MQIVNCFVGYLIMFLESNYVKVHYKLSLAGTKGNFCKKFKFKAESLFSMTVNLNFHCCYNKGKGCIHLCNTVIYNLFSLPNILRVIKSKNMRQARHATRVGENGNVYKIYYEKLNLLIYPGVYARVNRNLEERRRDVDLIHLPRGSFS